METFPTKKDFPTSCLIGTIAIASDTGLIYQLDEDFGWVKI